MKKNKAINPNEGSQRKLASLIPGYAQLKNQQTTKALLFGSVFYGLLILLIVCSVFVLPKFFNSSIGFKPGLIGDNSFYIMVQAVLIFIGYVIVIIIGIASKNEALATAKYIEENNGKVPTMKESLKNFKENGFATIILIPAYLLVTLFVLLPVTITIIISFTNYGFGKQPPNMLVDWVGLKNYFSFFGSTQAGVTSYGEIFGKVLIWTIVWTLIATTLTIILGTIVAFVFNQEDLKLGKFFSPLFLLPWAIPAFITIVMFSQMFADSRGFINVSVLPFLDQIIPGNIYAPLEWIAHLGGNIEQGTTIVKMNSDGVMEVPWKTNAMLTKTALLMMQPLLGFSYVFTVVLGSLKAIPSSLYQAAEIDGANKWQKFRRITLPLLILAILPVLITQFTFNFNNFGIIYLFNEGGPGTIGLGAGSSDILISWVYKMIGKTSSPQYGISAAVSILMSFITVGVSMFIYLRSNSFKKDDLV